MINDKNIKIDQFYIIDESDDEQRSPTYFEYLKDAITNAYFELQNNAEIPIISNNNVEITQIDQQVSLFGTIFQLNDIEKKTEINQQILQAFQQIVWFSYRKNFPQLSHSNNDKYISDTGWGCMVYLSIFDKDKNWTNDVCGSFKTSYILRQLDSYITLKQTNNIAFFRFKKHITQPVNIIKYYLIKIFSYSILEVIKMSQQCFNQEPGQWFKATTICMTLEQMNIKNNNPIDNKIVFEICIESCIFIRNILQKVLQPSCEKCKQYLFNQKKEKKENILQQYEQNLCKKCLKWQKSIFITICVLIGQGKPNPQYFPILNYMLKNKYSVGILGGSPGRALYFVGQNDQNLIYLDPHYVQESIEFINEDNIKTFTCSQMRSIPLVSIDSSLAFGFYLQNQDQFSEFIQFMNQGDNLFKNWIFSIMDYNRWDQYQYQNQSHEIKTNEIQDIPDGFNFI